MSFAKERRKEREKEKKKEMLSPLPPLNGKTIFTLTQCKYNQNPAAVSLKTTYALLTHSFALLGRLLLFKGIYLPDPAKSSLNAFCGFIGGIVPLPRYKTQYRYNNKTQKRRKEQCFYQENL